MSINSLDFPANSSLQNEDDFLKNDGIYYSINESYVREREKLQNKHKTSKFYSGFMRHNEISNSNHPSGNLSYDSKGKPKITLRCPKCYECRVHCGSLFKKIKNRDFPGMKRVLWRIIIWLTWGRNWQFMEYNTVS